jgi:hypothetical protein
MISENLPVGQISAVQVISLDDQKIGRRASPWVTLCRIVQRLRAITRSSSAA